MNLKEQLDALLNATAFDSTGAKVGAVRQVYVDDASGKLTFATVSTGLFSADAIVPLHGARLLDDELHVDHTRAVIRDSPRPDNTEDALTPAQEVKLLEYYGIELPAGGRGPVGPKSDAGARAPKGGETVREEKSAEDAPAAAKTDRTTTDSGKSSPAGKKDSSKKDSSEKSAADRATSASTDTPKKPTTPAPAKADAVTGEKKTAAPATAPGKKAGEQVVKKDETTTTTTTTSPSAPTRTPAATPEPSTSGSGERPGSTEPETPATSENSGKSGSPKSD